MHTYFVFVAPSALAGSSRVVLILSPRVRALSHPPGGSATSQRRKREATGQRENTRVSNSSNTTLNANRAHAPAAKACKRISLLFLWHTQGSGLLSGLSICSINDNVQVHTHTPPWVIIMIYTTVKYHRGYCSVCLPFNKRGGEGGTQTRTRHTDTNTAQTRTRSRTDTRTHTDTDAHHNTHNDTHHNTAKPQHHSTTAPPRTATPHAKPKCWHTRKPKLRAGFKLRNAEGGRG
jgi:hypothetical protein